MKKFVSIILIIGIILLLPLVSAAENEAASSALNYAYENPEGLEITAASAMLIEAKTGTVLYCKNGEEKRSPASVTKIMTLLLVCEAIASEKIALDDTVTVSAYAASMGGSQVFLEEGEEFTVEELLKCTVIASANDAAVALAELISGNEGNFVAEMNKRAAELGMKNTSFENVTGLDDTTANHLTSSEDIAIMSKELIKHDIILKYSSLWQDSIRNGEFTLTNTNRLVRFYDGCNGLKTGSTDKAGFCVSASAKRGNMQLIAVIMGAETRDVRNAEARALLDYGFANYALFESAERDVEAVRVKGGVTDNVNCFGENFACVVKRTDIKKVEEFFEIPETVDAPVEKNGKIGKITFKIGDETIGECGIYAKNDVSRINFGELLIKLLKNVMK